MASSSKNINMPVVFTVSINSLILLAASIVATQAWYLQYQSMARNYDQTQSQQTTAAYAEQEANLVNLEAAKVAVIESAK